MKIYKFVLLGLTSVSIKEGKTVKKMMALNRGKNILLCYIMRKIFRQVVQFQYAQLGYRFSPTDPIRV